MKPLRFALDANMPRCALAVVAAHGHWAEHVRDIGLGNAADETIDAHAMATGAILVTP